MKRGYSLVGVLAAIAVFSLVLTMVFRFNHSIEKMFYGPMDRNNQLRLQAWQHATGLTPSDSDISRRSLGKGKNAYLEISEGQTRYFVIVPLQEK